MAFRGKYKTLYDLTKLYVGLYSRVGRLYLIIYASFDKEFMGGNYNKGLVRTTIRFMATIDELIEIIQEIDKVATHYNRYFAGPRGAAKMKSKQKKLKRYLRG